MTRALPLVAALLLALPAASTRAQSTAATAPPPADQAAPEPVDRTLPPLQRRVTLTLRDVSLSTALRAIDRQADLQLGFTERLLPPDHRVSLAARAMPAGEALRRVLSGTDLVVVDTRGELTLVRAAHPAAADTGHTGVIVGRVLDTLHAAEPMPVISAGVAIKGTRILVATNAEGNFIITNAPIGIQTLTVRALGYQVTEKSVVVLPDTGVRVDIIMPRSLARLQEVVTTATGHQRRLEIPNAVTVVDADSVVASLPVRTIDELLQTRVPGLVEQHTSGAPGAPTRLRLRGVSAVFGSNDPIVVVDGHRVYARQSDSTSRSLAELGSPVQIRNSALSLLDQIDVNSIETIEVVSGPSAAALYGADAANGVIVITTKRGQAGPPRWDVAIDGGTTYVPGSYPRGYFRWGRSGGGGAGDPAFCRLQDFVCTADSLVRAQVMNDPTTTMLGHGSRGGLTATVSGGSDALTYRVTASDVAEQGYLKLPDVEVTQFQRSHGFAAPDWLVHPQFEHRWTASSTVTARVGGNADVNLTTSISSGLTRNSSLAGQVAGVMTTFYDAGTGIAYRPMLVGGGISFATPSYDLVQSYYTRALMHSTAFTNGVQANWRPLGWLGLSADAGINVMSRSDQSLLPRGYSPDADSVGAFSLGYGRTLVTSGALRATASKALPWRTRVDLNLGADYARSSQDYLTGSALDIPLGVFTVNQAGQVGLSQGSNDVTKLGFTVAPMLSRGNLYLSTGYRFDAANTYGQSKQLIGLPKLGLSWMVSEEPFFHLHTLFNSLQLRAAYGHAGSEPSPGDRLRLYRNARPWIDGGYVDAALLDKLGNTELRPQRVREFEGGFEAELARGNVAIGFTNYQKTTTDALMTVPVAPSVYGNDVTILRNVGVIRNTGSTITIRTQLLQTDPVAISVTGNATQSKQLMVSLGPGVKPFEIDGGWVVAGYPVFGRWSRPIVGYADVNGNGVIEPSEVRVGDTPVYMGSSTPDLTAGMGLGVSLFRGMLSANADFSYSGGFTQLNSFTDRNQVFSQALNDPSAPLGEQAATAALSQSQYGAMETVTTLRFNALSLAYRPPERVAHLLRASAMSVAVQGSNLGLRTNYKGKDPDVNVFPTGNAVEDPGVLPQPRSWQMRVSLHY